MSRENFYKSSEFKWKCDFKLGNECENENAFSLQSLRNSKNAHFEPNLFRNENSFNQQYFFHNLWVDIDLFESNRSGMVPEISLVRHFFPCQTFLNQSDRCWAFNFLIVLEMQEKKH